MLKVISFLMTMVVGLAAFAAAEADFSSNITCNSGDSKSGFIFDISKSKSSEREISGINHNRKERISAQASCVEGQTALHCKVNGWGALLITRADLKQEADAFVGPAKFGTGTVTCRTGIRNADVKLAGK